VQNVNAHLCIVEILDVQYARRKYFECVTSGPFYEDDGIRYLIHIILKGCNLSDMV
jgi:hypothetical protein